jgi:hypothetical protein
MHQPELPESGIAHQSVRPLELGGDHIEAKQTKHRQAQLQA